MTSPLADLLSSLDNIFKQTSSKWYVFGPQAAIIHGASRLTADVDITIMYGESSVQTLVDILTDRGFEIRVEEPLRFVEQSRVLPVLHISSGMPVDIVFGGPGLEEQFLQRSVQFELDGLKVPVASGEDIITMKILSGREKDLSDATAIIAARHNELDVGQIKSTLAMLESALDRGDLLAMLNELIQKCQSQ